MLSPSEQERLQHHVTAGSSRLSEVFDALSDNNRCQLFRAIAKRSDINVTEMAQLVHISVPLASQHLKILTGCRLLMRTKIGRDVFYRVNYTDPVVAVIVAVIND